MLNPHLDDLTDYPFERLRALLDGIDPPPGLEPRMLSVGEPRHAPPAFLQDVIAAETDGWGRYPPIDGTPAFRAAVGDWLGRRYALADTGFDPDSQVLPVAGTREALFLVGALAVPRAKSAGRPVVLVPNPFYQTYAAAAVMNGAETIYLPATAETGFLPDLDAIPAHLLARTAVFFLCSPANPQGAVASRAYLAKAIALARDFGFVLAVDECYAEIYDNEPPPGTLEVAGDDPTCILVFHTLSKRSSAPGLRSGFVAGDPRLIDAFRRLRSYGGATLPGPILAASAALWRDDAHVEASRALYRAKIDAAEVRLGGRFGFRRPEGGFFLWLDVVDGEHATRALWGEAAVRVLPGAYLAYGTGGDNPGDRFIRVALVDDLAATEDALDRLVNTLSIGDS